VRASRASDAEGAPSRRWHTPHDGATALRRGPPKFSPGGATLPPVFNVGNKWEEGGGITSEFRHELLGDRSGWLSRAGTHVITIGELGFAM
jgi:hypothetical protein